MYKTVNTTYGKGLLIGANEEYAFVQFSPGAAPELEKDHWKGGPCYTVKIPLKDVKEGE